MRDKFRLSLLLIATQLSFADSPPQSMAAMGDSITAGELSSFTRSDGYNPLSWFKLLYFFAKFGLTGEKPSAFETRQNSWSTGMGTGLNSHAARLKLIAKKQGLSFKAHNAAISGTKSLEIQAQVDAVLSWAKKNLGQGAPDYVTIEFGANDACAPRNDAMTPTADYGDKIRSAVTQILNANPNAKILLSGIPNLEFLRTHDSLAPFMLVGEYTNCEKLWTTAMYCQNILHETDLNKIHEVYNQETRYMHELETIASDYGDSVRVATKVFDAQITKDEISIDCFHPNKKGQQLLSDGSWDATWWNN